LKWYIKMLKSIKIVKRYGGLESTSYNKLAHHF
jgi:hypothetical protein